MLWSVILLAGMAGVMSQQSGITITKECNGNICQCVSSEGDVLFSNLQIPAGEKYNCKKKPTKCLLERFAAILAGDDFVPRCNKKCKFTKKQCTMADLCDPLPDNSISCGYVVIQSFSEPDQFFDELPTSFGVSETGFKFNVISPGLTGVAGTISFQSAQNPNKYLRHFNNILFLETKNGGQKPETFEEDATFILHDDTFRNGFVAFEAVNFPNCYIRHQKDVLIIQLDNNKNAMRDDSTWKIVPTGDNVPGPSKTCWCVNKNTGEEIPGTRGGPNIRCRRRRN